MHGRSKRRENENTSYLFFFIILIYLLTRKGSPFSKEEMDKFVTEFGNQARHGVSDFQEYSKEEMQEMIKQASEWYGTKDENHQITIKESGKYSISYTCDLSGTPVHMETRKLKAGDLINIDKL